MSVKVAVLGGSGVATPELAIALRAIPHRTQAIDLVLVGRSETKLKIVAEAARLLAGSDPLLAISAETSIEAALAGADFVLNQVRVGGYEARAFDETFSDSFGIPGEETVGPGGFANACRTIPVVLEYARLVERLCPRAVFLNLANPCSLVQYALSRYTRLETIGLCDAPVSLKESIARALGAEATELRMSYAGLHHFGFVYGLSRNGRDVLPDALAKAADIVPGIDPELVGALGVIPGHYLNYIFHPDRILSGKKGLRPRAQELLELQDEILRDYFKLAASPESEGRAKPASLEKRGAKWYRMIIAPVLNDLVEAGRGDASSESEFILNVVNGSAMPSLPPEAVVEVPALIRKGRVFPQPAGPLPPDVTNLIQVNCLYEMMAAEAIVERDRTKALRALMRNPMIRTYDQAARVLEKAWNNG